MLPKLLMGFVNLRMIGLRVLFFHVGRLCYVAAVIVVVNLMVLTMLVISVVLTEMVKMAVMAVGMIRVVTTSGQRQ